MSTAAILKTIDNKKKMSYNKKGYATIAGKKYPLEIRNGIRYINGLTVDKFLETLTPKELAHAALVGQKFIESRGQKSPQKMFNELHQSDNN